MGRSTDDGERVIATNRRARHLYAIEETVEAGLVLVGTEVKSLRAGQVTFGDSYVEPREQELWLVNLHIGEYKHAHRDNHEPLRPRKLLLRAPEIERVADRIQTRGYSAVPLQIRIRGGWIKVEIGLGRGKKLHDKRETLKRRQADRDIARGDRD